MSSRKRSAELLDVIAKSLGTDAVTLIALSGGPSRPTDIGEADAPSNVMLLSRMVRAFLYLPDDEIRLRALQYVESLAASRTLLTS